jgi:hypothetical protein
MAELLCQLHDARAPGVIVLRLIGSHADVYRAFQSVGLLQRQLVDFLFESPYGRGRVAGIGLGFIQFHAHNRSLGCCATCSL